MQKSSDFYKARYYTKNATVKIAYLKKPVHLPPNYTPTPKTQILFS